MPDAQEIVAKANELADLADSRGRGDLASRLEAEIARPEAANATVVVVGETKRGKSSLVNALLGRPDLSPTGVPVTTSRHLVIRHAPSPIARVHYAGDVHDVPIETLPDWMTVAGEVTAGEHRPTAGAVEVGLDHPLLARGLTLVDTPGIGGLNAAHTAVTLAALARAEALVFVVDASAPFSKPELDFLEQATERIGTVAFVLAKIDLYPGWRTIEVDDRTLLAEHARLFGEAPFIPVSSVLKERGDAALAQGKEALGKKLVIESGIPELEGALQTHVIDRAGQLHLSNILQMSFATIGGLSLLDNARRDPDDEWLREALAEAQEKFQGYAQSSSNWVVTLGLEFARIQMDMRGTFDRRIAQLSTQYEERVPECTKKEDWEAFARDLGAELAALGSELELQLDDSVTAAVESIVKTFELDALGLGLGIVPAPQGSRKPIDLVGHGPMPFPKSWHRVLPQLLVGAGQGRQLATGLGVAGAAVVGTAAGLLIAALGGSLVVRDVRSAHTRNEAVKLVRSALGPTARIEIQQHLETRLLELRSELQRTLEQRIATRGEELAAARDEQRRLLNESAAARERAREQADRRLQKLQMLRQQLEQLANRLPAELYESPGAMSERVRT